MEHLPVVNQAEWTRGQQMLTSSTPLVKAPFRRGDLGKLAPGTLLTPPQHYRPTASRKHTHTSARPITSAPGQLCILSGTTKAINLWELVMAFSSSNTVTTGFHNAKLTTEKISTYLESSLKRQSTYPSSETQRDCCRSERWHTRTSHWLYCSQRRGFLYRVQNQAAGHRPSSHLQNNYKPHDVCLLASFEGRPAGKQKCVRMSRLTSDFHTSIYGRQFGCNFTNEQNLTSEGDWNIVAQVDKGLW